MNYVENNIYTIVDAQLELSGPIFEAANDKVAINGFRNQLGKYPGKFNLVKLGKITHQYESGKTYFELNNLEEIIDSIGGNGEWRWHDGSDL